MQPSKRLRLRLLRPLQKSICALSRTRFLHGTTRDLNNNQPPSYFLKDGSINREQQSSIISPRYEAEPNTGRGGGNWGLSGVIGGVLVASGAFALGWYMKGYMMSSTEEKVTVDAEGRNVGSAEDMGTIYEAVDDDEAMEDDSEIEYHEQDDGSRVALRRRKDINLTDVLRLQAEALKSLEIQHGLVNDARQAQKDLNYQLLLALSSNNQESRLVRDDEMFHAAGLKLEDGRSVSPQHVSLVRCVTKSGQTTNVMIGLDLSTYRVGFDGQDDLGEWTIELAKRLTTANGSDADGRATVPNVFIYTTDGMSMVGPPGFQLEGIGPPYLIQVEDPATLPLGFPLRQLRQIEETQTTLAMPSDQEVQVFLGRLSQEYAVKNSLLNGA